MTSAPDLAFLDIADRRIAVRHRAPTDPSRPTLVFLPGYASDMAGAKALAVDRFASATGCGCLRFDYSGSGSSGGSFAEGTLDRWLAEAIGAIDALTAGPLVLVGSSMGGWLMLHVALRRRERIAALVGIAIAADFTEWGFTAEQKAALRRDDRLERPNPDGPDPFVTHGGFWRSGAALRLLGGAIDLDCPVRLLHGECDDVVPVAIARQVMERLYSADVQLVIVKGAGHRLSEPREIDALLRLLAPFVETAA